jgi:hypothetical protein
VGVEHLGQAQDAVVRLAAAAALDGDRSGVAVVGKALGKRGDEVLADLE